MEPRTNKSEYARALDLLTRYLSIRDHSRFELQTKLALRFSEEVVEQALAKAEASGWLRPELEIAQDAAEAFIRRGKSSLYIETELRKRNLPIPPRDDEKELETLRALFIKKFGQAENMSREKSEKAYRFLSNRGFEDRMIRMVLNGFDQE